MTWAARLIEQHFDAVFYLRGEAATIQRWLSALPDDLVRSRPRLLLAQALMAAASGRVEAVEPLLDAAERASAGAAEEPFEPTAGRAAQPAGECPRADRAPAQLSSPSSAVTPRPRRRSRRGPWPRVGEDEWMLSSAAQGFLAVAEWLRGRLAEAERAFVSSIAGWRAAGQPTFDCMGLLSPRPGPAGPGPPGRGRPDLPAGAGDHRAAGPAAAAGRRPGVCGPGRGGLPAERARHRAPACHRGHRAVPAVRLHRRRWPPAW